MVFIALGVLAGQGDGLGEQDMDSSPLGRTGEEDMDSSPLGRFAFFSVPTVFLVSWSLETLSDQQVLE